MAEGFFSPDLQCQFIVVYFGLLFCAASTAANNEHNDRVKQQKKGIRKKEGNLELWRTKKAHFTRLKHFQNTLRTYNVRSLLRSLIEVGHFWADFHAFLTWQKDTPSSFDFHWSRLHFFLKHHYNTLYNYTHYPGSARSLAQTTTYVYSMRRSCFCETIFIFSSPASSSS